MTGKLRRQLMPSGLRKAVLIVRETEFKIEDAVQSGSRYRLELSRYRAWVISGGYDAGDDPARPAHDPGLALEERDRLRPRKERIDGSISWPDRPQSSDRAG